MQIIDEQVESSISGFTYEQIEDLHAQMLEEAHPDPPEPTEEEDNFLLLRRAEDVEFREFFSQDRMRTLIYSVRKSRNLNLKLVTIPSYIEVVENDATKGMNQVSRELIWYTYGERIAIPTLRIVGTREINRRVESL
jgi:hypothetical protein